jgi:tRNA(His) 5'-end guanylyltransferase
MKFDDLDRKMRVYETVTDRCTLPEMYVVARLDGRSFTRLTKETHRFETPFDVRFRDMMVETVKHLMTCGFNVLYGYTESDEISLLLDPAEQSFGGKHRKLLSILAGESSAKFSLLLGDVGVFDCRLSEMPNCDCVADYFRWRAEDAHRNCLNAHCYWQLRKDGKTVAQATNTLVGMSIADKNELLFSYGTNFNNLPAWQKRGVGVYWQNTVKQGFNPITNQITETERRELYVNCELEIGDKYSTFIRNILEQ